ncbi:MAG: hypothetical protein FK733_01050 [Asgard group archaeon]|nr:hypothetical protein [Asgard group archaeon]
MAIKEAKSLELLPRMSATEKKIFSALTNQGISNVIDISAHSGITKGRVPAALEKMMARGLVVKIKTDDPSNPSYAAVYPIKRFVNVTDKLMNTLEGRRSELDDTTDMVREFTEYVITTVREVSVEERRKQSERAIEDTKDLEMILDASFSGILTSVEVDLQDLSKIAQTSIEFLTGSSIRTQETCFNLRKDLVPLTGKFSKVLQKTRKDIEGQLESTVDTRVSSVLELEVNVNKAFDEILEAFKVSQDAFEDIIFSVLDSGIDDLEKVTRPINDQIEEAIHSLKIAIQDASNNFQTEILRVLTEQKRPIVNTIESLRPRTTRIITEGNKQHNSIISEQFRDLSDVFENHTALFSDSVDQLAKTFDERLVSLITQTKEDLSSTKSEVGKLKEEVSQEIRMNFEGKYSMVRDTANKTRDVLNEMMEQFILILNQYVAEYQLSLGDVVAKLENDFLANIDNSSIGIQNLVNYITVYLTEPIRSLMRSLSELHEQIEKEESDFLEKFDESIRKDLLEIGSNFKEDTKKTETELKKDVDRLINRFDKEIDDSHNILTNRLSASQKHLQTLFKNFSAQHDKELRNTSKEVNSLTKKLERWRGESVNLLSRNIDDKIDSSMNVLSDEIDEILAKIENTDNLSKDELVAVVKQSYQDISKSFKGFGGSVNQLVRDSLDDIANTLKKDSRSINNRLAQFRKDQDKLMEETKKPSYKLMDEISHDYKDLYNKLLKNIERFFESEFDSFVRGRDRIEKTLENILNRRGTRTSKEIASLREAFDKTRETYVKKTRDRMEDVEKTISRDTAQLLDQEKASRSTITTLTDKIIIDLSNNVNSTAERLRKGLWEGSEEIFGQAAKEIDNQEEQLISLDTRLRDKTTQYITEFTLATNKQFDSFEQNTSELESQQIGDVRTFREQFTARLDEDLKTKLDSIDRTEDELHTISEKLTAGIKEVIDVETNKAIRELEAKTSGIEGAIFSTVGQITAEAARRTESVVIIGEQAVLGIEERYTENLERIRQSLTDEVVNRIDEEGKKIEVYKDNLKNIGREHLESYGEAMSTINATLVERFESAEEAILKTATICEDRACRYLEELDEEINAMGNQVGRSTAHFTGEIIEDFGRLLRSVKREVANFAKNQFELSDKSNAEIAEAFLKSVDDLEEVMIKQFLNYTKRTNNVMERTKEITDVVKNHIKDITESFHELTD